jgi:hypothetical protein
VPDPGRGYGAAVGADLPAPPPHDERPFQLQRSSWIRLGVAVALALTAIALFPRSGGDEPPLASLALIGAVIAGVTTAVLYTIVRRDLGLPSRVAASLAFAFVLIALVKLVLAPLGLYEVNAVKALDDYFGTIADPVGAVITAIIVFGLYALGYGIIYRIGRRGAGFRWPIRVRGRTFVVGFVGLILVVVSGVWVIVLAVLAAPGQYLEFVFSSGAGVIVAVALAIAATIIGSAFRTLDRQPQVVAEVGAIVSLFWLGLGFLALFHVLWIVYVLVLGSIWPLRTVVPK